MKFSQCLELPFIEASEIIAKLANNLSNDNGNEPTVINSN
jgi:hypothetical protein